MPDKPFEHPEHGSGEQPDSRDIKAAFMSVARAATESAPEQPRHVRFESLRELFPEYIRRMVEEEMVEYELDLRRIGSNATDGLIHETLENMARRRASHTFEHEALDPLTKLFTLRHTKEVLAESLGQQLKDPRVENFSHIVRITLDVDGLKAINDLNDGKHEWGDEYLRLVANALKSGRTIDDIRRSNSDCRVLLSRDHGDDFGITIIGSPGTDFNVDEMTTSIVREIGSIELPADMIPLHEAEKKLGPVPPGLRVTASASGGGVSAETVLRKGLLPKKNMPDPQDTPDQLAHKLMGAMISASETLMKEAKDRIKRMRASGTDAERYYLKLISPRDAQLVSEQERLERENDELRRLASEQRETIEALKKNSQH